MHAVILALVSFCIATAAATGKPALPDYFKLCHIRDPEVDQCIKQSVIDLKPYLVKGIPELNIIPLDPLHIPVLELNSGSGNFAFRNVIKNLTITGLRNFQLLKVKTDLKRYYMEMVMRTPFMTFTGQYEIEGKILLLPISGQGDCTYNFTDVRTTSHMQGKLVEQDGVEYMIVKDLKWDIEVGLAQVHLTNLFNGQGSLGDATNKFLNDNWQESFNTYKHLPEEAFGQLFKDLSNRVYQQYPYKDLFLE